MTAKQQEKINLPNQKLSSISTIVVLQQCAKEKSTKLMHVKGAGIDGNPECAGIGVFVDGVQGWLVHVACLNV